MTGASNEYTDDGDVLALKVHRSHLYDVQEDTWSLIYYTVEGDITNSSQRESLYWRLGRHQFLHELIV